MTGDKSGRHRRREREFRFRRSEILDAAEKLFSARGFHGTTMAEIAASSGFSIGGLYQFFSGKEQLYSTMVEEKVRLMYDGIMGAVDREESVEDKIRALVIAHFAYVEHHVDFYRLLIGTKADCAPRVSGRSGRGSSKSTAAMSPASKGSSGRASGAGSSGGWTRSPWPTASSASSPTSSLHGS